MGFGGMPAKLTQMWGLGKVVFRGLFPPGLHQLPSASRIFCSLLGGSLEVLCQCGKA